MSVRLLLLALVVSISACSSHPHFTHRKGTAPESIYPLLQDHLFSVDGKPLDVKHVDLFRLPDNIAAYLNAEIATLPNEELRFKALRRWAYDEAKKYEYDPNVTATIDELPNTGKINCFSFSNLFLVAARHLGIPADIQLVYSPPNIGNYGKTTVLNEHINVTGELEDPVPYSDVTISGLLPARTGTLINTKQVDDAYTHYTIDINNRNVVNPYHAIILEDHQILSRYYSNKGAESLFAKDYPNAYANIKQALIIDKASSNAWNNLGVLYSRIGETELARQSYLTAIQADPFAQSARNNLASINEALGQQLEIKDGGVAKQRGEDPFFHYALGEDMFGVGEYAEAIRHYKDAIELKDDEQLFYLAIAAAEMELGNLRAAEKNLTKAEEFSDNKNEVRFAELSQALAGAL